MNDHPTPAELEGFVWSRIAAERARLIASHLIRGCEQCLAAIAPHLEGLFGASDPPERHLSPREEAEYDSALNRAFEVVQRKTGATWKERNHQGLIFPREAGLESLPEISAPLRSVPLLEALLERSWALRYDNPDEMVRLAKQARRLAEGLQVEGLSGHRVADLRCRACVELGNAYRVADQLPEAEAALAEAAKLFHGGSQDETLAARLFDIQASLYADQRRFDLAQTALDLVYAIHKRRGNQHLAGRALISKGIYAGYEGEPEEAIRLIQRGLECVDEKREPRLVFVALHSKARFLVDCGLLRDARITLFKLKSRGLDPGGRLKELRVRWLEGQINVGLGELDRAEQALIEAKEGFEEAHLGYKAALVGLELGAVMLQQGRSDVAKQEILQAADVFMALGIQRETAASVLLLRKAFEQEMLDSVLLDHVIALLHRAERAPEPTGAE